MPSPDAHTVEHLHVVPTQQGTAVFLVLPHKTLVIQVDPAVGEALQAAIAGKAAERPLTHDLMLALLQGLDAKVERVVISDMREGVFFARVVIKHEGTTATQVAEVDARPSDSLVLAVKSRAPVMVMPAVADACEDMAEALAKLRRKEDG
jgi:bifunctional DNase/RNase